MFDAQGQFIKKRKAQWSIGREQGYEEEGIVNAGVAGCYLYATLKDSILFQKLDMDNGTLGKEIKTTYNNNQVPPVLLNGYEKGILIAEENTL